MPPMETARPQANGIIGLVNGEAEPEEEKISVTDANPTHTDSVFFYIQQITLKYVK